jgi:hypothetical protein
MTFSRFSSDPYFSWNIVSDVKEERSTNQQKENKVTYQTPRAMQKQEVKSDMTKYEATYKNQVKTLTQFFAEHVVNAWDANELSAAELITIKDNLAKKQSTSLIVIELKSR